MIDFHWVDVAPSAHPINRDELRAVIDSAMPDPAAPVFGPNVRPELRFEFTEAMNNVLVARFGAWTAGWRWGTGESTIGGGVLRSWCCETHSVTTAAETADRVEASVLEWRAWLEDLEATFDEWALPAEPSQDDYAAWDRAVARLVTKIADETNADDAWYALCEWVLVWCLEHAGVPAERRNGLVHAVIGGRFASWIGPSQDEITDVAGKIADRLVAGG